MGDTLSKGDLLVEVDHAYFKEQNVDMTSPVIVTNLNGRTVVMLKDGFVEVGEPEILSIKV